MSFLELAKLRKMYELGNPMSTQFQSITTVIKTIVFIFQVKNKGSFTTILENSTTCISQTQWKWASGCFTTGKLISTAFFFFYAFIFTLYSAVQNYYMFTSYSVLLFRETERNYILASLALGDWSPKDLMKFCGAVIQNEQKQW